MEEAYARAGEGGDDAARVAGHVGHLGGDSVAVVALVEAGREGQSALEEGPIHGFGLDGVGHAVPDDVAAAYGAFEAFDVGRRGLVQVFPYEPGAGGPDVAFAAAVGSQPFGYVEGFGDEFVEVVLLDFGAQVGEADVEVSLEDDVDGGDAVARLGVDREQGQGSDGQDCDAFE